MLKYIGAATATVTSLAGGLYYTERNKYITDTIKQAEADRQSASEQCSKLESEIQNLKKEEAKQQLALQDKMSTVESLWNERERRVQSETQRAADAIFATPEGYSILNGITHHCNDFAQKFPYFYEEFDLNASKVHTIAMLLNTVLSTTSSSSSSSSENEINNNNNASSFSLRDVAPALGMFRSDPFISSINLFLRADMKLRGYEVVEGNKPNKKKEVSTHDEYYTNTNNSPQHQQIGKRNQDVMPADVSELSKTFGRLMNHFQIVCSSSYELQQNVKRDSMLRKEKDQYHHNHDHQTKDDNNSNNNKNNKDDKQSQNQQQQELGFFVERVVPKVADSTHLITTAEADYLAFQSQKDLQKQTDVASSWNLYDNSDLFAAISYVTKTHDKIVTAASRGERWAVDSRVAPAMKNLLVWSVAAEQYLSEMQTREVLKGMVNCMSHSFVQINDLPPGAGDGGKKK